MLMAAKDDEGATYRAGEARAEGGLRDATGHGPD